MKVKTVPLSVKDDVETYTKLNEIYDKVIPIGVGYKKYLEKTKPSLRDYCLVINTHDEVNIHYVIDGVLNPENSTVIKDFSIEYCINGAESVNISKLLDVQLNVIFNSIDNSGINSEKIIILENSTDLINYFNKTDKFILTDPLWKYHENRMLKEMVDPEDKIETEQE
ncbi:hypothetical protein YerA41_142 [Yersinia phage YerA41]|uniref:Uncharacterized protein n=1 Tax=Yersinia phage vB_Yru_GN1 TaxID=3074381 RepID=A0AA86M7R7_9CAUD|nr:hypothetical protein YerA41_142 [Yersinia phage YerA41]BES79947.1 hypothetical protein [Yersinia phage vB_Yru_GN1]